MERFICIHGHFYQPPRENPWLEAVEIQDGAHPYHDWNERITDECYAPNATSRILDDKKRITKIVNNYAKMSFDMGPTLLSWLEVNSPETYAAIVEADRLGAAFCSGHGPAMAQAYGHMIMPLANSRDKRAQIIWGIRDFIHRFKRQPEGMWLPETAVDLETLGIAASMGIRFTVLAPHQARRVRRPGGGDWRNVPDGSIDTTMPYLLRLPSGGEVAVFFYNKALSHAVAFERLLESGEGFARRLTAFPERRGASLMHIATDGESYGHHHRFGDMALAFAINHIKTTGESRLTNYGEFLEKHPPTYEVEIAENTSWSCAHGVNRWRADCGCSSGANPRWNQKWRAPLRAALDYLRDELSGRFEAEAGRLFHDPWAARDDYIGLVLDRSVEARRGFLERHALRPLGEEERTAAIRLLELQRHLMLMYTSCGWFFDDISGIETLQVLSYAGRAIQLSGELLGDHVEEEFVGRLKDAKSNVPEMRDGAFIYGKFVRPAFTDNLKVGAHYAISSLFKEYPERSDIYCYSVERLDYGRAESGKSQLISGKCLITSNITGESGPVHFSVFHLGNHDFNCAVHRFGGEDVYKTVTEEMNSAFAGGAFADIVRIMDAHFGANYSLKDLFRDEQRKILYRLLGETIEGFEAAYRRMYEENKTLMAFLKETGIPVPKAFYTAAEFILNLDLKREFGKGADGARVGGILREAKEWKAELETEELQFVLRRTLTERMSRLEQAPGDGGALEDVERALDIALSLPFSINLWAMQNIYYRMARGIYREFASGAASGDREAALWVEGFRSLGLKLYFNLDAVLSEKT